MAAYTGVPVILRKWEVANRYGQQVEYSKDISLTLVAQGGLVNSIGKAALGFAEIYSALAIRFVDGSQVLSAVTCATDGTNVYLGGALGAPTDFTGTLTLRVTGKP